MAKYVKCEKCNSKLKCSQCDRKIKEIQDSEDFEVYWICPSCDPDDYCDGVEYYCPKGCDIVDQEVRAALENEPVLESAMEVDELCDRCGQDDVIKADDGRMYCELCDEEMFFTVLAQREREEEARTHGGYGPSVEYADDVCEFCGSSLIVHRDGSLSCTECEQF